MKKGRYIFIFVYNIAVIALFIVLLFLVNRGVGAYKEEYSRFSASRSDMAANFISSYLTSYTNTLSSLADMEITK